MMTKLHPSTRNFTGEGVQVYTGSTYVHVATFEEFELVDAEETLHDWRQDRFNDLVETRVRSKRIVAETMAIHYLFTEFRARQLELKLEVAA
jgi:hypothetical protein